MHNNCRYIDHVLLDDNICQKIFASVACLNHMVTSNTIAHSITNSESTEQYARKSSTRFTQSSHLQSAPVFVLCERCYWCATFLDKNRLLEEEGVDDDKSKICPRCDDIDSISSLPIVSNESFTFNYTVKRGIELRFRKKA
jgi:hypothetical protein